MKDLIKPRFIFTFMFFATACYLMIIGSTVPNLLKNIIFSLMGFYYGEKIYRSNNGNKK